MISLGDEVKDVVTGFQGIVTGKVSYLTGCDQALVVPKVAKDGTYKEGQWIDIQRLERKGKKITLDNTKNPGFDLRIIEFESDVRGNVANEM